MTASSGFSQGHKHPGASPLWADPAVAVGGEAVSAAPRDVASMKAEIAEIQSDTTQSLDRVCQARVVQYFENNTKYFFPRPVYFVSDTLSVYIGRRVKRGG